MKSKHAFILSFFLLLVAIPIFYNLAGPAIFIYDEAIYANNALEMAMHGDPWVLKNNGEISLYNTKPPLMIWLQCLMIKLLGPGELAIRLPSALAALSTALLLLLFAHRTLHDYRIGLVAMLVLVTSGGYIRNHVARSGDLDALLVFWITFYTLLAFTYLLREDDQGYKKSFTWIGIGVLFAFFTKSVAGLMPLLGIALGALAMGRLWPTLKKPYLYLVATVVASICGGYYFFREQLAPGYLEKVFFSEYSRFTQNIMPWHEKPFWFYLDNMWNANHFQPYLLFLPLAIIAIVWKPGKLRNFGVLSLIFSLTYFFLIAYPKVKINYYDAPLYPFLALLLGGGLVCIWDKWLGPRFSHSLANYLAFAVLLAVLFFIPYRNTWQRIQYTEPIDRFEREGYAIRNLASVEPEWTSYKVLMNSKYSEHLDQANYYIKAANHFAGTSIALVRDGRSLEVGEQVLCCQSALVDSLRQQFEWEEKKKIKDCIFYQLKSN